MDAAAAAHEDVLIPVGHAYHLVGHHLADGQNQIVGGIQQKPVHFHVDGVGNHALGNFGHVFPGHHADFFHVRAPGMHLESLIGNVAEHGRGLFPGHGHMGAQGGKNVDFAFVLQHIPDMPGNASGVGMQAGIIRGQQKQLFQRSANGGQGAGENLPQLLVGKARFPGGNVFRICNFHSLTRCRWRRQCPRPRRSSRCGRIRPWARPAARRYVRRSNRAEPAAGWR